MTTHLTTPLTTLCRRIILTAAALTALFSVGCRRREEANATAVAVPIVAPVAAVSAVAKPAVPQPVAAALPGMRSLVNSHGIRVKVLISQPNVRGTETPDGDPTGPRLRYFWPYFVFETYPANAAVGAAQFYRVGSTPRPESIVGWVPATAAVPWDTRVGARYRRRDDGRTPPLLVYADKQSLVEQVTTGRTSAEPIARAKLSAAASNSRPPMPWPVIDSDRVTANGRTYELMKLAFLGQYDSGDALAEQLPKAREPQAGYSAAEFGRMQGSARQLDVVFVLDTTASMQPAIDAAKSTIETLADRFRRIDAGADVAFGLVAFRDYDKASGFVVHSSPFETNPNAFLSNLRQLHADEGGDIPEAVYDGVQAGLDFPWRSPLSRRVVVLIGDAPAHEPGDPQNPRGLGSADLIHAANDRHVSVMTLSVESNTVGELKRLRQQQFGELASKTGGACHPITDADAVADRVRGILLTETARVQLNAGVLADVRAGKDKNRIAAEHDVDVRQVTEVMQFLIARGIDMAKLKAGGPTFSTGWALCEVRDTPVLDREVFIAQPELDVLLASLNLLCTSLSSDFAEAVAGIGLGSRVEPLTAFFRGDAKEPLDVFLMSQGVPLGNGSVLRLTPAEIRHMPEERRALLREKIIRRVVPQLTNCRTNASLWSTCDDLEFGWIPEEVLP